MITCCDCKKSLETNDFSKSQLKKPEEKRRCKSCAAQILETEQQNPSSSDLVLVVEPHTLKKLVKVLLSTNRIGSLPENLREQDALARRLFEIFSFPAAECREMEWLVKPLVKGLINGRPDINKRIQWPGFADRRLAPILHWLVRPKCPWFNAWGSGENLVDIVDMALGAGANPNLVATSAKYTAMTFAIYNGTTETVRQLAAGGANLDYKDDDGDNYLFHALQVLDLDILTVLLEHISVKHPIATHYAGFTNISAADMVLGTLVFRRNNALWSRYGNPTLDTLCQTLLMMRRRGSNFTQCGGDVLRDVLRGFTDIIVEAHTSEVPDNEKDSSARFATEALVSLTKMAFEEWLPDSVSNEIHQLATVDVKEVNQVEVVESFDKECPICLECIGDHEEKESVSLYCGHEYCVECIVAHGEGEDTDATCPLCHQPLCLDLIDGSIKSRPMPFDVLLQENRTETGMANYGPNVLTAEQVALECDANAMEVEGLSLEARRDTIRNFLDPFSAEDPRINLLGYVGVRPPAISTTEDSVNRHIFLGPFAIPITVKSVPILAFISTTSYLTLLSPAFVDTFGLKRMNLHKDLSNVSDSEPGFTAIDDFVFTLGDSTESIRLANVMETEMNGLRGVQLGLDFLLTSAWSVFANIEVVFSASQSRGFLTTDCFGRRLWNANDENAEDNFVEELRYYSRNGTTVRVPLLRLQDLSTGRELPLLAGEEGLRECRFCCLRFPFGMIQCQTCKEHGKDVYYCDEECMRKASKIHSHVN